MSQPFDGGTLPANTMADQGPGPIDSGARVIAAAPPKPPRGDATNELHMLAWGFCSQGPQAFKIQEDPVWLATQAASLCSQGVDLEARDLNDYTPLAVAIIRRKPELAIALLRCGANPCPDSEGASPLHLALDHGFVELAIELAQRGADLSEARSFWGTIIPARAAEALEALERWRERQALSLAAGEAKSASSAWPAL